jgi:hypothetical protein
MLRKDIVTPALPGGQGEREQVLRFAALDSRQRGNDGGFWGLARVRSRQPSL